VFAQQSLAEYLRVVLGLPQAVAGIILTLHTFGEYLDFHPHIPDKGVQMVRYYGWYSNKMRGVRQRGLPLQLVVRRPGVSPPPPAAIPSKRWRDLILRVWHVDPLRCPVCNNPMRVIALIDDPAVVRKILRHLGLWHDPPPVRASPGQHECLLEPWLEDPMPDYENVLTD
jgi:hypothetical protein